MQPRVGDGTGEGGENSPTGDDEVSFDDGEGGSGVTGIVSGDCDIVRVRSGDGVGAVEVKGVSR